ncbi:MAG: sulfotransferase [Xanthomonadales bacterium]|jgi:tetratricopeptide (TPR) repeat protein|nr:sulfotransferase [Xanthomonadales bacterium]
MSKKKNKSRRKVRQPARPRQTLTGPQNLRLQQAVQAQSAGNLAFAESAYRTLITENVKIPQVYNNLGLVYNQTGRQEKALKLFKMALSLDPRFVDARMHLATAYEQAGETDKAVHCYQQVLAHHPGNFVARYQMANQLKAQGKLEEAIAHYRKIMQQNPGYTQAHFTYSGVHKYENASDPHIVAMLELYQNGALGVDHKIHLSFALAKAFEDLKDFPQAFHYLKTGNDLRYKKYQYTVDSDEELISNIIETFSAEAMSGLDIRGESSDRPIFIVGMPRSGTTLVEKILASHSEVYAGGELDYLFSLGASHFLDKAIHYQFRPLNTYAKDIYESVGTVYLEKINQLNGQARHITDKLPFNCLMIGLIRIALPHAKIVHCVRDPRDTCLSIYKQNFATENYRFAYDLKTVGQYHNLYRNLMQHWHRVLPGHIYDIEYESLTQNPEVEIRALLSACGLHWQDACLDFHQSDGLVKTASFYQVRQPMYTSSVQLWQHYEAFLEPLLNELNAPD